VVSFQTGVWWIPRRCACSYACISMVSWLVSILVYDDTSAEKSGDVRNRDRGDCAVKFNLSTMILDARMLAYFGRTGFPQAVMHCLTFPLSLVVTPPGDSLSCSRTVESCHRASEMGQTAVFRDSPITRKIKNIALPIVSPYSSSSSPSPSKQKTAQQSW
jgi:hypothetical protein